MMAQAVKVQPRRSWQTARRACFHRGESQDKSTREGVMPSQSHVVLKGTERVALPGARALGEASAHEWVEVTVKLRRQADLPELAGRPKAPISRAELAKKYGASQADVDKV